MGERSPLIRTGGRTFRDACLRACGRASEASARLTRRAGAGRGRLQHDQHPLRRRAPGVVRARAPLLPAHAERAAQPACPVLPVARKRPGRAAIRPSPPGGQRSPDRGAARRCSTALRVGRLRPPPHDRRRRSAQDDGHRDELVSFRPEVDAVLRRPRAGWLRDPDGAGLRAPPAAPQPPEGRAVRPLGQELHGGLRLRRRHGGSGQGAGSPRAVGGVRPGCRRSIHRRACPGGPWASRVDADPRRVAIRDQASMGSHPAAGPHRDPQPGAGLSGRGSQQARGRQGVRPLQRAARGGRAPGPGSRDDLGRGARRSAPLGSPDGGGSPS